MQSGNKTFHLQFVHSLGLTLITISIAWLPDLCIEFCTGLIVVLLVLVILVHKLQTVKFGHEYSIAVSLTCSI